MKLSPAFRLPEFLRSPSLLTRTLLVSFVLFFVLEIWRPYYFLTDDNLSAALPFLTEMGRHLKSGQSPFFSDYLFGGHYNLLRDANYFSWSPLTFLVSLLADTPGQYLMCELLALFNILLASAGFVALGTRLRGDLRLDLSDGRLAFYALSFVYSTFILTCSASWIDFLPNEAVLPWLALGIWEKSWRRSLGLLVLFSLHQTLSGHSAVMISNDLALTLFALLVCGHRRSFRPLASWIAANVITLILIAPIIYPALEGFLHSRRSEGLTIRQLNGFSMPAALFPISFLFGNFFEMAAYFAGLPVENMFYFPRLPTLLACAASWCIFPAVMNRRRWTLLEIGCASLIVLLVIMVIRPRGITECMTHVPLLKSMRWPFREILQLLFFFHLFLVLRPATGAISFQNRIACASLTLFLMPLFFTRPLSLNPLLADRAAIFSGQADHYWFQVKLLLKPGEQIATVIDPDVWYHSIAKPPYSLTGTADFPVYFRFRCISGYSQTPPVDQLAVRIKPFYWFGAYDPTQVPQITDKHPGLRIITVEGIEPLHLSLSNPAGPPIDLTPYLSP